VEQDRAPDVLPSHQELAGQAVGEVVVSLIDHTTTRTGLAIRSELDENNYPTGREVTDQQMESLSSK